MEVTSPQSVPLPKDIQNAIVQARNNVTILTAEATRLNDLCLATTQEVHKLLAHKELLLKEIEGHTIDIGKAKAEKADIENKSADALAALNKTKIHHTQMMAEMDEAHETEYAIEKHLQEREKVVTDTEIAVAKKKADADQHAQHLSDIHTRIKNVVDSIHF